MQSPTPQSARKIESVLRKQTNWNKLWFYQKTVVLYQMTYAFTRRFLPAFGDRTVDQMVQAARSGKQNNLIDYEPFFEQWTDEEMANIGITLCKMVDKMMMTYQTKKEEEFVTEGGIRERMTAARLGYRTNQRETVEQLTHQVEALQRENAMLKEELEKLKK